MEKNSRTNDEARRTQMLLNKPQDQEVDFPGYIVRGVLGKKLKKFLKNFSKHLFCVFKGREYLVEYKSFTFLLGDRYST